MDDLDFLSSDSVNSKVQGALGYKPKQQAKTSVNKVSDFDVNKTYGTPSKLLDNLNMTESSGDPYAVNKDTKAMGNYQFLPDTVAQLHKQGIQFNPFDPKESRAAADYYIQKLANQNSGDYSKAMAQYGGFKTKDPSQYLGKVLQGVDFNQQPAQQAQTQAQQPTDDLDPLKYLSGASVDLAVQSAMKETAQPKPKTDNVPAYKKVFNKLAEESKDSIGTKYIMPAAETAVALGTGATTGLLSGIINTLDPGSKEYREKKKAEFERLNPNQKYILSEQQFLEGVGKGTILPKSERGQAMLEKVGGALSTLPPVLAPELAALSSVSNPVLAAKMANRARKVEPGVNTIVAPEFEKAAQFASTDTPTYLRKKFAEKQAATQPVAEQPVVQPAAGQPIVQPITQNKPYAGNVEIPVPEETPARLTQPIDSAKAAETEQLLRDVGIENIRLSALNEDPLEASSQYITSKAEKGTYGAGMREQISHEKTALENHFNKIESELGGTIPKDVVDEINRGKTVKNALEEAQESHAIETSRLYTKATEEIGDAQVGLNAFQNYLNKESNFVHGPEQNLRSGVRAYLKEQELIDKEGNISPMTVEQSENLRKFINSQYNYETKNKIGKLVNTIDDDVFENVQGQTYEEARAHFQKGREIYDNPKAIKDLLKDEGVNQKVADEKVMTKITTLDQSQFEHLIDTLKETGKEDALREIQTNLVNRIKEAGRSEELEPWNSRAAAKERVKLSAKLQKAFEGNEDQLERINKGIAAGNKIYIPTKYPGAAVQTHLLNTKFGNIAVKAGTYLGAKMGGGVGAVFGENMGARAAQSLAKNKQTKQLAKEIKQTKLSDIGKD
jgi:hypothetical protein